MLSKKYIQQIAFAILRMKKLILFEILENKIWFIKITNKILYRYD